MLATTSTVRVPGLELPAPPADMAANQTAAWLFVGFCGVMFVLVLGWALWMLVRRSTPLPLALMAGGALCGLVEPTGDILGLTWYPSDTPLVAFTLLGRHVPAYVPVGEAMFFALAGYGAYRLFLQGRSVRHVVILLGVFALFDAVMEMGAIQGGAYVYYGNNPSRILGLPFYAIVQNGGLAVVIGWVALVAERHLRGVRWLVLPLLVPTAFVAYAIAATWPVYLALGAQADGAVVFLLAVLATGMNFAIPFALLRSAPVAALRRTQEQTEPSSVQASARLAVA